MIVLTLSVMTVMGCKDETPAPTSAVFTGTITMENIDVWNEWKDLGEVQVTVFPAFSLNPPAGWGEIDDNLLGPGVPGGTFAIGAPVNAQDPLVLEYDGQMEFPYTFTLSNMTGDATFSAIAVGFRHDTIQDPQQRTATLGVHWSNPDSVSHGIVIKPAIGAPPIFDYPAPSTFIIKPGDEVEINFKANFGFVEDWYQ